MAAKAAGYQVVALDMFADVDTRRTAHGWQLLEYRQHRFTNESFTLALNSEACAGASAFIYGSGFEAAPELLETAASYFPVFGNTAAAVRCLKLPQSFFRLLDELEILHPAVSFVPLTNELDAWLHKLGGGSGGMHLQQTVQNHPAETGGYFQRKITGEPVSMLFAADGAQVKVIGYNRQWLAPGINVPYRYGGAVSHAVLPQAIKHQLLSAAAKLTKALGLRGFNSIDALMDGEQLWVLEINPRLSASVDLYQTESVGVHLFDLHIKACHGDISDWPAISPRAKAQSIVYAPCRLQIPAAVAWPLWVTDLPLPESYIATDNPVCSVSAEADTAEAAQALVGSRMRILTTIIQSYKKAVTA